MEKRLRKKNINKLPCGVEIADKRTSTDIDLDFYKVGDLILIGKDIYEVVEKK